MCLLELAAEGLFIMELKKSLLVLSLSSAIMAGAWTTATAKTAQEDDSVYRWGRWAVLTPAAGNEEVIALIPPGANDLGRCESAANCPSPVNDPQNNPEPPGGNPPGEEPPVVAVSPCAAGMPCGFARVDHPYDRTNANKPDSSDVVPFELVLDEQGKTIAYVVDPGSEDEIASGDVGAYITPTDVLTVPGSTSELSGSLKRNAAQVPVIAQGLWTSPADQPINGGEYVWGITATANEMQSLISSLGGTTSAVYQGFTMGTTNDNEGTVQLNIDFGSATWSGQFNADLNFSASGAVVNSGFVSNAAGFSSNIASGEVKGGFVNAGNNAIGGYEVVDTNGIQAADVFNTTLQNPLVQPAL